MKKFISILLIIALLFSITACGSFKNNSDKSFSVMENAEIVGDLKGTVATEGTFIEVRFPEETTFDTVVIKEKDNQIENLSI